MINKLYALIHSFHITYYILNFPLSYTLLPLIILNALHYIIQYYMNSIAWYPINTKNFNKIMFS